MPWRAFQREDSPCSPNLLPVLDGHFVAVWETGNRLLVQAFVYKQIIQMRLLSRRHERPYNREDLKKKAAATETQIER